MKEKKVSVRLQGSILDAVESVSQDMHIGISEAIRLFIKNEKIVVIKEFENLISVLNDLTMLIEKDECIIHDEKLREGVELIWLSLNSLIPNQREA